MKGYTILQIPIKIDPTISDIKFLYDEATKTMTVKMQKAADGTVVTKTIVDPSIALTAITLAFA